MREKKNKIFKKALVFSSVFIILLLSCSTIAFAQAPDFDNFDIYNNISSRNHRIVYCYDSDNELVFVFTYNVPNSFYNFTFTENYYYNYYTGDILTDINVLNTSFKITGIHISGSTPYIGNASTTLYNYCSTRGITDNTLINRAFTSSYYDQITYWQDKIDVGFEFGYSQAIEDYDLFENGLLSIFNAPFVFVQNIVGFEMFGISLADVVVFILLIGLSVLVVKILGGLIL